MTEQNTEVDEAKEVADELICDIADESWESSSFRPRNFHEKEEPSQWLTEVAKGARGESLDNIGSRVITTPIAVRIAKRAHTLIEAYFNDREYQSRSPKTIASASLYAALLLQNYKETQSQLADRVGLSTATVGQAYRELVDEYGFPDENGELIEK